MTVERIKIKDLPSKDSILDTDILVESDTKNTYKIPASSIADYVSNSEKMKDKYVEQSSIGEKNGIVPLNSDKEIEGYYIQYGTTTNTAYEGSAGKVLETNLDNHIVDDNNPHNVTKTQVGLGNVENKSSETIRSELTKDNVTKALGFIPYTQNEIDNKFSSLETSTIWKPAVDTYDDIAITYPNPEDGWTVNVKDTDYTYRYSGTEWIAISANAIPKATNDVDGLLSKEDHINYEDANNKKHTHSNKSVLDGITSDLVGNWNAAKTHADSAHAPSNAQENIIEKIKVNGTTLTPDSKSIDIPIPIKTSELENDSGFKTTDNNTTYVLGKSESDSSTLVLTGSDGSSSNVKIEGLSGGSTVSFKQNLVTGTKVGTLTIDGKETDLYAPTNTDTHYKTGLKVGNSNISTTNQATTNGNVYLNILDDSTVRDSHKIVGSGATNVTSDANGVITIESTDTTYTPATLGNGYGTCTTAEATTAKVVSLSNYLLNANGIVSVKFSYAVPAGSTMNINGKGAKSIYYRGTTITGGVINAGDIATFIYNGSQYILLAVDNSISDTIKQVISETEPTAQNIGDQWLQEF